MAKRAELDPIDEVVRLMVVQLRLQIGNQAGTIAELSRAGFNTGRIAELLGTTSGTVSVALQRVRHGRSQKPKDRPDVAENGGSR
jgi:hypothetical protein